MPFGSPGPVTFAPQPIAFTVPSVKGSHELYRIDATLEFDFLLSGALGLMLRTVNQSAATASPPDLHCVQRGECVVAESLLMNQGVLRAVLEPGHYELYVYAMEEEVDRSLLDCLEFAMELHMALEPIKENFLSCSAHPLPAVLNPSPMAMLKDDVHYADSPLIDLDAPRPTTTFAVLSAEGAFFRVWIDAHRIDIDVRLFHVDDDTGERSQIDNSLSLGDEEVIVAFLQKGKYLLEFEYYGTYDPVFCETFDVEIALQARPLATVATCPTQSSLPDLSALPAVMAAADNNTFVLEDAPGSEYVFAYDGDYSSRTVYAINFTVDHGPRAVPRRARRQLLARRSRPGTRLAAAAIARQRGRRQRRLLGRRPPLAQPAHRVRAARRRRLHAAHQHRCHAHEHGARRVPDVLALHAVRAHTQGHVARRPVLLVPRASRRRSTSPSTSETAVPRT